MNIRSKITLALTLLSLWVLSCSLSLPGINREMNNDLANTQIAIGVTQAALAAQQTAAAQTPPPPPAPAPNFTSNGLSLTTPPEWSIRYEVIPSDLADSPYWGMPEREGLYIQGYPVKNDYHDALIQIIDVNAFQDGSEVASERLDELTALLVARPADPDDALPSLPVMNAARLGLFKQVYVDFQNGSGVRFITQYGQAFYPFHNQGMVYVFQGLTQNGRYYISALLPLAHPSLEPYTDIELSEDFYNSAEQFLADQVVQLEQQPDASFNPPLATLDALLASLRVEK